MQVEQSSWAAECGWQHPPGLPGAQLVLVFGDRNAIASNQLVTDLAKAWPPRASLMGFYSYGEISPFTPGARCELHNQTMTVTTFAER